MKRWIKLLTMIAILSVLTALPAYAAESAKPDSTTYDELSSTTFFGRYCTVEQPDDALPLKTSSVTLTLAAQTDNYSGGYYNLPRLRAGYYYRIYDGEHKDSFTIPNTVYPVLKVVKDVEVNDSAKLGIFRIGDDTSPVHFWTIIGPAGGLTAAIDDKDCSADFDTSLYPKLGNEETRRYYTTETTVYNHALHKYGFVTRNHMIFSGAPENIWLNDKLVLTAGSLQSAAPGGMFDENSYKGTLPLYVNNYPYYVGDIDYVNQSSWDFNKILSHDLTDTSNGFLLYYSGYENIAEGNFTSGIFKESGASIGTHFIAVTDEALYAYTTSGAAPVEKGDLPLASASDNKITVTFDKQFDLRFQTDGNQRLPFLNPYAVLPNDVKPNDYTLTPSARWDGSIFVTSQLPGGAYEPGAGELSYDSSGETFTVEFKSNGGSAVTSVTYRVNSKPTAAELPIPSRQYYTFSGWFVDEALTKPYVPDALQIEAGGRVTMYAKWDYNGGTYHVVFYDRKRDTSSSADFNGDVQPTFPTINPYKGYSFKNWELLGSANSTSGNPYDPMTFKPVPGNTYYFNAVFATSGIIKSVTNTKDTYYLGDSVDKGHLSVVIQTDDKGATRTLSSSEFSVSPATLSQNGSNSITVTYTETGATAVISLSAVQDTVQSISASYEGSSLTVGSAINTGSIKVTRRYKSGKTDSTSDFTISPSTVQSVGTNSIRVTSGGLTTTITVTGTRVAPSAGSTQGTKKNIQGLTAAYIGSQLYVGDTIKSSDISVTATYSDGSTAALSSSMFNYTPSYVRRAGTNTITVVYSGITTSFTVDALENSTVKADSVTSPGNSNETAGNKGSSSTVGNGGTVSGISDDGVLASKTTSRGYLGGSNILSNGINMNASSASGVEFVNDIDILSEIRSVSTKAASIDINLINLAKGNTITSEMLSALAAKEVPMNIFMSDGDSGTQIARWMIDGARLDKKASYTDFDPNLTISQIAKNSETMLALHIYEDDAVYEFVDSLTLILSDMYSPGSMVTLYKTDASGGNSVFLLDKTWGNDSTIDIPLANAPYFMLTDASILYPDGTNLLNMEPVVEEELETEVSETSTEQSIEQQPVVVKPEVSKKKSYVLPVVLVLLVFIIGAVAVVATVMLRKKEITEVNDEDDYDEVEPTDAEPPIMHYDYDDDEGNF